MHPVDSRSIDALGYDDESSTLYVRFRDSGDTYVYYLVPRRVFEEFTSTDSPGRFLNQSVKGKYPFARVSAAA